RADRNASIRAVGAASKREVARSGMPVGEEVFDVVWSRDPRLLRSGELVNQPAIQFWTPARISAVIDTATGAVDERELAVVALAIPVLVLRKDRGRIPRVVRRELGGNAAALRTALLRRDDNDTG